MTVSEDMKSEASLRYDLIAIGIIFFSCLAYALTRFLISPNMELDESQQFLNSAVFAWGYGTQAPLYTWIVKILSSIFGFNTVTLVVLKFLLIFLFYVVFFKICRLFWDSRRSLLITGALVLFPLYLYEFTRDLSHTILLTLMSAITCFLYMRVLTTKKLLYYALIGISIGFGVLSKYNFLFLVVALLFASMSFQEGRNILFSKKTLVTIVLSMLIISPHMLWLMQNDYLSILYGVNESRAGHLYEYKTIRALSVFGSPYLGLAGFLLLFILFFFPFFSEDRNASDSKVLFVRWATMYGLLLPVLIIVTLQIGHFSTRWLAPVYFLVPLALFSTVDLDGVKNRLKYLGYISSFLVVGLLCVRILFGFMPDITGKTERTHVPFQALSEQITQLLNDKKINKNEDIVIITNDNYIEANLAAYLPDVPFVHVDSFSSENTVRKQLLNKEGIFVWELKKQGKSIPRKFQKMLSANKIYYFRAPYLHSRYENCTLGGVFIKT